MAQNRNHLEHMSETSQMNLSCASEATTVHGGEDSPAVCEMRTLRKNVNLRKRQYEAHFKRGPAIREDDDFPGEDDSLQMDAERAALAEVEKLSTMDVATRPHSSHE